MTLDVMSELQRFGAVLTNQHFIYASGRHGPHYINMDTVFPEASLVYEMSRLLVEPFLTQFDTIAGPAVGGVVLCEFAALAANSAGGHASAVWADKDGGEFVFARAGFVRRLTGKRVLLVEDLLTTGGSLAKVRDLVESVGGDIIGASVVCNRGGVTADALKVPRLESLVEVEFESFDADSCPLCNEARPIVLNVGRGSDFKALFPSYRGGFSLAVA